MGRNRVFSFISQFSALHRDSKTPTPAPSPPNDLRVRDDSDPKPYSPTVSLPTPAPSPPQLRDSREPSPDGPSPIFDKVPEPAVASSTTPVNDPFAQSVTGKRRSNSRPLSMVLSSQQPLMESNEEIIPELQPIFALLSSHANKLYQEGYFLKLDDQDIILSLWDAAELDTAGEDGEVLPKFINLTDASIKMIESLPTRSSDEQPLQNILSISTAGRNRYLLHFNSHHSLIQWTSGIRLAIFEQSTLQEAYTGALIAGKGKSLNNIGVIMERARTPVQEWVRVRFGAGVPWRRCWCVIEPPSEKEVQKAQKEFKKRSPYDRSHGPVLKGQIKFYDSKKDAEKKKKHSKPIASITDAYAAYAIYPQAKALIDGSALVKIEGSITIHSEPPSSTEGFVFIMPEVHPAVSGFEMLLRFLFPTWDTFALYGRPGRLVASVLDPRSLMFAMPKHKRYGYLELLDVSGLILADGSSAWTEQQWKKKMKELTGQRMNAVEDAPTSHSRSASRSSKRLSFGQNPASSSKPRVGFSEEAGPVRSSRSLSLSRPSQRTDSAPPDPNREPVPSTMAGHPRHSRNISDTQLAHAASAHELDGPGAPQPSMRGPERARTFASDLASTPERVSSEDESAVRSQLTNDLQEIQRMQAPEPVNAPPAFSHGAGSRPQQKPYHSPEMRRAHNPLTSPSPTNNGPSGPSPGLTSPHMKSPQNPSTASLTHSPDNPASGRGTPPMTSYPGSTTEGRRTPPHSQGSPRSNMPGRSPPVTRKPLPPGSPAFRRLSEDSVSSLPVRSGCSAGGLHQQVEDANLWLTMLERKNSVQSYSDSRSIDAASTASPDYASTHRSTDTQESADRERPRAGILKVVGDTSVSPHDANGSSSGKTDLGIDINFGPTFNYSAMKSSSSKPTESSAQPSRFFSPNTGRKSPGPGTSYSHFRQDSDDTIRRTVPWQPGSGVKATTAHNALSPEQFVQQRAAAPPIPIFVHQRSPSSQTITDLRATAPSSPLRRPGVHGGAHSRHNSAELLSSGRPASRGPVAVLSSAEVSSHLSAREQEYVARATGTPLIAMASNKSEPQPKSGLVGAIQQRERERAHMRQGVSGQAVAHAIDQRQRGHYQQAQRVAQQAAYAQQQAHRFSGHFNPNVVSNGAVSVYKFGISGLDNVYTVHTGRNQPLQPDNGYESRQARPRSELLAQRSSYALGDPTAAGHGGGSAVGVGPPTDTPHGSYPLQSPSSYNVGGQNGQAQFPVFGRH
ncbi:hypothetical protein NEUTE1DRAFT_126325 [Neurospora tetrasperma FGSC 2508]|uniref:Skg3/CAF120-like PH-like domain-containing protein n=1 Tax=Neurospora tetrasperma (strain FGSC 2508 / ATCC MYA-4615 / P0657) TaxID=510951 RepID=F8MZW6_NEUT8|nr:uncharacterized protein NEUTE1DRAFT_126325 [Neurospora tetrasperma FGSC 2508]EGO52901.1 hypothetical protein NEUTE1DRAFT_126325 [Neurospora tetrasperma FGSC 2508]